MCIRDSSLDVLLTNMILEEEDKVIFPEGEYTLPMTLPLDKSITLQGAGQSQTIVNGHISVNSPSGGSVALTVSDMTLKGTDNSSAHGLIGMIGTGKDIVKLTNCKLDGGAVTAQTAAVGVRMESVGCLLYTSLGNPVRGTCGGIRKRKRQYVPFRAILAFLLLSSIFGISPGIC